MSDLDVWITVIVLGALVLIPGRAWIERRIRSARARRIVLIVTACDHPIGGWSSGFRRDSMRSGV